VSHTTRAPREGETHGKDYHFVERQRFDELVQGAGFAEWAEYVDNCYGTAKSTIENAGHNGEDLLFDIELQGARQLKAIYPDAVTVFLLPPSWSEVERRLRARGTDTDDKIRSRLARGQVEIAAAGEFDYLVTNDDIDDAVKAVEAIYLAATLRSAEQSGTLTALIEE
jgi:guanylate kinase